MISSVFFVLLALQIVFGQDFTTCPGNNYIENDRSENSGRFSTTAFYVDQDTYLDHVEMYMGVRNTEDIKWFIASQESSGNNYNPSGDYVLYISPASQVAATQDEVWVTSPTLGFHLQAGKIYSIGAFGAGPIDQYFCCFAATSGNHFHSLSRNGNWAIGGPTGLYNWGNGGCDKWVKFYTTAPPPVAVCGNGIVETGEQCDSSNCCTAQCTYASSSTVCRASAGICDVAETCTGSSSVCPADSFKSATTPCPENFGVCDVNLNRMCPGNSATCSGFAIPVLAGGSIQWTSFHVTSFGGLAAQSGNIGGRTAVRNSASMTGGFSVGSEVVLTFATPNTLPNSVFGGFSLVVGGDLSWNGGELYPDSERSEYALVGGSFTGSDYLASRVYANSSVLAALPGHFDNAQSYYTALQNNLALEASTVTVASQYSGLYLTCQGPSNRYVASINSNDLSASLWWNVDGSCSYGASWVINVVGNGDVVFQGGNFPGIGERVLFNVVGNNRLISVTSGVTGSILAPNNQFVQTGGVTSGLVIVKDVQYISSAENPNCAAFKPFDIIVVTPQQAQRSVQKSNNNADEIEVAGFSQIVVGDVCNVKGYNMNFTVVERIEDNGKYYLRVNPAPTTQYAAGSTVTCHVSNAYANRTQDAITMINSESSAASVVSAISALFVMMIVALF